MCHDAHVNARDPVHPITVRQLAALDFLTGATLLGGADGMDRVVHQAAAAAGATAARLPDGCVLVLDGSRLRDDTYLVDIALRRLAEAHGAALIVVASASPIGVPTARLANKLRTPLFSLPVGDALSVCDSVREARADSHSRRATRVAPARCHAVTMRSRGRRMS